MDNIPESNDVELLYHLRMKTRELEIELDTLNSVNIRLANENSLLANDLNEKTKIANTASSINAELRLMLFKAENERDELSNSLQTLKGKYNKLYDKYAVNDRTFKAINQSFKDVNRSNTAIITPDSSRSKFQRPPSTMPTPVAQSDPKIVELHKSLEVAYDRIEELEFELESLEMLEYDNNHLRNELNQLKQSTPETTTPRLSLSNLQKVQSQLFANQRFSTPVTNTQSTPVTTTKHPRSSLSNSQKAPPQLASNQRSSVASNRFSSTSSSSHEDYRYSTATSVDSAEILYEEYNNNNEGNNNKSSENTENIYECVSEAKNTTVVSTAFRSNNDVQINSNESSSAERKPILRPKPSFMRSGARASAGSEINILDANETATMLSLVDELQQFKFKNSSQGLNKK